MRYLAILAVFALTPMNSAAAQERALTGYDGIVVSGAFRTQVTVADEYSLRVAGPDADRIRTRVDGDTLKVDPRGWRLFGNPHYDATVTVTLPRLTNIAAARGAEVSAQMAGDCTDFDAVAAMGATLTVSQIQCGRVEADAAMGGNLTLNGVCDRLDVSAAMGGVVRADGLQCRFADASAAMGGTINAFASESYDASAAMGGDVSLSGSPREGERSAVMGGWVRVSN